MEIVASNMGWKKVLDKEKNRKSRGGVQDQPKMDHTQKPPYTSKKLQLDGSVYK